MCLQVWTPFQSTLMSCIVGIVLSLEMSFWVNTDLNCSFKMLALALVSLWRNPSSSFSGAIPVNSCPLLFTYAQNFFRVVLKIIAHCVFYVWFVGPPDFVLYFSLQALYLAKSILAFVLLAFLWVLCFLLITLFISVFIHGLACRDVVMSDDTLFSIMLEIAVLRQYQGLINIILSLDIVCEIFQVILYTLHVGYFPKIYLSPEWPVALIEVSNSTMAWSLLLVCISVWSLDRLWV